MQICGKWWILSSTKLGLAGSNLGLLVHFFGDAFHTSPTEGDLPEMRQFSNVYHKCLASCSAPRKLELGVQPFLRMRPDTAPKLGRAVVRTRG